MRRGKGDGCNGRVFLRPGRRLATTVASYAYAQFVERRLELLDAAPGPAPWYGKSLPDFQAGDRTWSWRTEPGGDDVAPWPVLRSEPDGIIRFVPGWYTYAVDAGHGHLLVWRSRNSGAIELKLHRVESLAPVAFSRPKLRSGDLCGQPPAEAIDIPLLPPGAYDGFSIETPVALNEVLLLATWPTTTDLQPALAVYAWQPGPGTVTVFPQTWFTPNSHDLGYEWVTRIARDPESGRLVGDGIRIPAFELDDDAMTVRRLFEK